MCKVLKNSLEVYRIDILVCNPPFFDSMEEKTALENSIDFQGQNHEVVTPGGEVEFVGKMITESYKFRKQIKVFSIFVGRKNSIPLFEDKLSQLEAEISQYNNESKVEIKVEVKTLYQGNTLRWTLMWTFKEVMSK